MARRKPGQVVFAPRGGMGAGKGDFPRNISEKFRENHDKFAHLESIQDVLPDDHPLKIKQ